MSRLGVLALSLTAAGCASGMTDNLGEAPAWFEERRAELGGAEYPDLQRAALLTASRDATPWDDIKADLAAAEAEMDDLNDQTPTTSPEEMLAWAAERRAEVAKGEEPY